MAKKTWEEKFNSSKPFEVKRIEKKFADIPENGLMLIATPQIIADYLMDVPEGKSIEMKTLRNDLAIAHNAEYSCPVTSGIFLRIVAETMYERIENGAKLTEVAPFWRAVDPKSKLAQKLTCGPDWLQKIRNEEGLS